MAVLPRGFIAHAANIGIKDDTPDFSVVMATGPATGAAVFTRSRFAGPSVELSRANAAGLSFRGIVTISKNANVATGSGGAADAKEIVQHVASTLGVPPEELLIGSTGVIGRPYPMDRIRAHLQTLSPATFAATVDEVATAIMTTDTHPKLAWRRAGDASVVGVAKGVGMIEPDMATLLAYVFTDAQLTGTEADRMLRAAVATTFNCLSIDTDTSTSDTAILIASGTSGPVDLTGLQEAVHSVCLDLTRQIARDGEGATKLLEVHVDAARDGAQAKRVAKSIVNSPLVKTAVHGADPNWGRVAMAIGKCSTDTDIVPERTVIRFGDLEVFPAGIDRDKLARLEAVMAADEVRIDVSLGTGTAAATVWGCDLSAGYVRINADYTT
jgi:glutamate N-acetyltransferase/amino-acid N-acetyltransferase